MPARLHYAFFWTLFPLFFSNLPFLFFAPYLIQVIYRCSSYTSLWHALFCGLIIDLLSASSPFGLYAINYVATVWLLFPRRQNFFEDKLSTLPLMTSFFSFLSTALLAILAFIFGHKVGYSWKWIGIDLITLSILDGVYAFLWYTLPLHLLKVIKRGKREEEYA